MVHFEVLYVHKKNLEMDNTLKWVLFIKESALIIPPRQLLRKMIISQLELGPPVRDVDQVSLRDGKIWWT